MWQLLVIPSIGVLCTLCVWNLLSLATACTSLTNVAGGQRISATRKGDYENPPSYPMEFSPLVYFDETDYNSASCLNASEYKWSVNLSDDSVIQHVLVMSYRNTIDLGSFELGVGRPCCSGQTAAQETCISVCNNTDVDVYPSEQHQSALSSYPTLYVYRVRCLDDVGNLKGSYVTLSHASLSSPTQETICGLKVIGCEAGAQNMALGKPTQQSSNYIGAYSHLAVDGSRWQVQWYENRHHCTHTEPDLDTDSDLLPNWWRVDLEQSVLVSYVLIYNRDDGCHCGHRLHNFTVEFGFEDASGEIRYDEWYFHPGAASSVVNITCLRPMCARYIRIIKGEDDPSPLSLCEVEVYRVSGFNVPENCASTADPEESSATVPTGLSTTQNPPASDHRPPAGSCKCRCVKISRQLEAKVTSAAKEAAAAKVAKELLWKAPESEGTRFRKKNSVSDQRSSSQYVAVVSLSLVAAVCACVVLPDVVSFVYFVVTRMRDRRGRVAGRRRADEA